MSKWFENNATDKDVVVSSRIRLARNFENVRFPHMMNQEEVEFTIKSINDSILNNSDTKINDFVLYRVNDLDSIQRKVYVEKHLISPKLIEVPEKAAFMLKKDNKCTIMINEEDHIRLQVLLPGFNLEDSWNLCNEVDDVIEKDVKYAFDEKFGYLTSCPTNIGTGMRASVMIHLPCLVMTKKINSVLQAINQLGLAVRGIYGEGTNALGNLFQISNQTTLGETEDEIIEKLKDIVIQIIDKERLLRDKILNSKRMMIEDKVFRSLGILKNARVMTSKESMQLLSNVKLGVEMGIIADVGRKKINNLMIAVQPYNIQNKFLKKLNEKERDEKRAELIREQLK